MSAIRDRSVVRSSVIPSAKYCWSASLLRLVKGSTTIERRGATSGCEIGLADGAVFIGVEEAVAWSGGFSARGKRVAGQSHHAMLMAAAKAQAAISSRRRGCRIRLATAPAIGAPDADSGWAIALTAFSARLMSLAGEWGRMTTSMTSP